MEIDSELLEVFLAESAEQLGALEQSLLELETRGAGADLLQNIFRTAHTLKGNAACLGLTGLTESAHVVEDVLDGLRSGQTPVSSELVTLLLQTVDAFRRMVGAAGASGGAAVSDQPDAAEVKLFERIAAFASGGTFAPASGPAFVLLDATAELDGAAEPVTGLTAALDSRVAGARTLRVKVDTLDRMLDVSGEIAIARGRLQELLGALTASVGERVMEAYVDLERLSLDLQEQVRRTRMVPVGPLFQQYRRITREVSAACGKEATLSLHGEDVEVDTSVIELLRDPLTHMIRNAIDHGIEAPSVRAERGKPRGGRIELRAYHEAGNVVIEVRDDGAGIDSARVAEKARSLGLIKGEAPSERELLALIFEPGFSTTQTVTELSGRGVGMDVVRRNVEALRGVLNVDTVVGSGTTITLRLPLTLAIIEGLVVGVGSETYVVPLETVSECVDAEVASDDGRGAMVVDLRHEALPCLDLRQLLGVDGPPPGRQSIVVVSDERGHAGLIVDALLGRGQVVVKPLGHLFRAVPGIGASTILGSGRVALILDVPALLRDAANRQLPRRARTHGITAIDVQSLRGN